MLDNLCGQPAPTKKPLAIKKKVQKKKKSPTSKGKGAPKEGKGADKTAKKADLVPMAKEVRSEAAKEKKRIHSKAYHHAYTNARNEGKGAEEAKAIARKAGTDATRAWSTTSVDA